MGGVGVGGWRIFNSSLVFTVLLGFVMSASAYALTCEEVPAQPGTRAEPKPRDEGGCEYYRESDGTIVVTLTYADELSVDHVGDDPAVEDPHTPRGYTPGAYTCLHYYEEVERNGDTELKRVREVGHESVSLMNKSVSVDKKEGQLIFEYSPEVECEEGEEWVVKFEMFNGNPYVEMDADPDPDQESFSTVSHIGYKSGGGSDEDLQLTLGTLTCFNRSAGNSPATGAPRINGMPQVDETLTADTSNIRDANGLTNVSYAYQWLRVDGGTETFISGAQSETYMVRAADGGKQLKVRVNFTDDNGYNETLTSDPTATVNAPATGAPTIDGTPQVDETLTADTSNIRDANGLTNVSYAYQWLRVDSGTEMDIANATGSTYMVRAADGGKQLKVRVNFTDDDGYNETLTSGPTATVNTPAEGMPMIDGTPQEGQRLTADTSNIMDTDGLHGVEYSYQWIRVDDMTETPISGADERTYMVTAADVDKQLRVRVNFTDDAGHAEELTSEPTAIVTEAPVMLPDGNGGSGGGGGGGRSGRGNGNGSEDGRQRRGVPNGYLDVPAPDSFQSGIGVICGWVCDADEVEIILGDMAPQFAAYGTERLDTAEECGDTNNGFGLLFNWNRLKDGVHTVRALVDGVELGRATVTVTTLGEEFVRGVTGEAEVMDFPEAGKDVRLAWQQSLQNFMIAPMIPDTDGQ